MEGHCELCGRPVNQLTSHHLIPKTRHRNRRVRRDFARRERKAAVAHLCRACHNFIHANFTEKTLERECKSLETLATHPEVARFLAWVRTKPPEFHPYTRDAQDKQ
jgi:hypothetical protein